MTATVRLWLLVVWLAGSLVGGLPSVATAVDHDCCCSQGLSDSCDGACGCVVDSAPTQVAAESILLPRLPSLTDYVAILPAPVALQTSRAGRAVETQIPVVGGLSPPDWLAGCAAPRAPPFLS